MKYLLTVFGCQMNQADAQRIRGIFHSLNFEETTSEQDADIILFITCCVRKHAEQRLISRIQVLNKLKKNKPNLKIGIGGCLAQNYKDRIFSILPNLDFTFGPNDIEKIPQIIQNLFQNSSSKVTGEFVKTPTFIGELPDGIILDKPFSAYVNIIKGCTNYCSYCIVPYVRGPEVSRPIDEIVDYVKNLVERGVVEITLLGQNVNAYGKDLNIQNGFIKLLEKLENIEKLQWIRFITSHPRDFSKEMITQIANLSKVCEHFHLPAQSGSNRILKLMNRGYTREQYLDMVYFIREKIPNATITTDLICGFPTETEEEFEETLDLIQKARFEAAYTYYFSPRPNTLAEKMDGQIPLHIRKERLQRLIDLHNKIAIEESQKLVGKKLQVLFEGISTRNKNQILGKTRSSRVVDCPGSNELIGKFGYVIVKQARNWTLSGELV